MTLSHAIDAAAGLVVVTAAALVAQGNVETFWPTSAIGYVSFFVAISSAVGVVYGFHRFLNAPVEKRFAALESRLQACEETKHERAQTAAALQEVRGAQIAFRQLAERLDETVRMFGRDLAHLQGAFEAWDGRERRRSERRHSDGGAD